MNGFFRSFTRRFSEPSTYAGISALALAVGQFSDNNRETSLGVMQAAEAAGQAAANSGGDWVAPAFAGLIGLAAVFAPERKGYR
jgi:hypothetical protein